MARPVKHDGGLHKREGSKVWWMRYRDKDGVRRRESTLTEDWGEAQKCLRERLQARDNNPLPALRRGQDLHFGEWADIYLDNFSKPPFRAPKTHAVNERALKHLRAVFEKMNLADISADAIESTTVHQELRVLRRMLNVAVRKSFSPLIPARASSFLQGSMDFSGRAI